MKPSNNNFEMQYPRQIPECDCHSYNMDIGTKENILLDPRPYFKDTTKIVCIDACIAPIIKELWENGVQTCGSCCGHNKSARYLHLMYEADLGKAISVITKMDRGSEWYIHHILENNEPRAYINVPLTPFYKKPFTTTMIRFEAEPDNPDNDMPYKWVMLCDIGSFTISRKKVKSKWCWALSFLAEEVKQIIDVDECDTNLELEFDMPLDVLKRLGYNHYTQLYWFFVQTMDGRFTKEHYDNLIWRKDSNMDGYKDNPKHPLHEGLPSEY